MGNGQNFQNHKKIQHKNSFQHKQKNETILRSPKKIPEMQTPRV